MLAKMFIIDIFLALFNEIFTLGSELTTSTVITRVLVLATMNTMLKRNWYSEKMSQGFPLEVLIKT